MDSTVVDSPQKSQTTDDWAPVKQYYNDCAEFIESDAKAMGWSSAFTQALRFDMIDYLVGFTNQSVLDVGCGDAGLWHYLNKKNIACDYRGVDISTKMVQRAQARYPGIAVRSANMLDVQDGADIVVCSGGLSMVPETNAMAFLEQALTHLFGLAQQTLVFNVLSTHAPAKSSKFQRYNPVDVMQFCFTLTPYVSVHHGYLPNDFTVLLTK
jgi:SAM-dependent methyltransferase